MTAPEKDQALSLIPRTALLDAIRDFLLDCQARRLSGRTVCIYRTELAGLRASLEAQGVPTVTAITATHQRAYLLELAETRNAGGQHLASRVLRTFLRWYERECEPSDWRNPVARVKPPRVAERLLPPVPLDDLRAMLRTCTGRGFADVRDRAILLCLLDCGARAAEFLALDAGNVDLGGGAVMIHHGKGGRGRVTFLGTRARRELAR